MTGATPLRLLQLLISFLTISSCECEFNAANDKIIASWLVSEHAGFFLHPSLVQSSAGDFIVKESAEEIKESEVLMVIPSSAVLSAAGEDEDDDSDDDDSDDEEEEEEEQKKVRDDPICDLFDVLSEEFESKDESNYALYLEQLVRVHSSRNQKHFSSDLDHDEQSGMMAMPSAWSFPGRRLLTMVNNGSPQDDIVKLLDQYRHCLTSDGEDPPIIATKRILQEEDSEDDSDDEDSAEEKNRALELSNEEKLQKRTLEIVLQHQIDHQFLVPLYDQMSHHHYDYNVVHQRNHETGAIHVVAIRSLKPGDRLTRPSLPCSKASCGNLLGALKLFGHVQRYPHFWDLGLGPSFVYHGRDEGQPFIEWITIPTEHWQLDYMENEISRQTKFYELEVLKSKDAVPASEWIQVKRYSQSVRGALSLAVTEGRKLLEMRSKSPGKEQMKNVSPSEQAYLDLFTSTSGSSTNGTDDFSEPDVISSVNEACDPLKDCTFNEIAELRGCWATSMPTVDRNASEWHLMRTSYVNAVGPEKATIQATPGSGFRRPYKVAHSPARGRGVFSTEDIPKGSLIWTNEYTAYFDDGDAFRRFLAPLADDMVCDLVQWCYTSSFDIDDDEDGPKTPLIGCDLDEGTMFNFYDDIAEYNVGYIDHAEGELDSELTSSLYAMRDIAAGEELVTSYDEFDTNEYPTFGL